MTAGPEERAVRRSALAGLALAPALLLGGCGGGGANADDEEARATYLAAAERVCGAANARVEALTSELSAVALPADLLAGYAELVSLAESTARQLEDLTKGSPDAAQVNRVFLAPLRGQLAALRDFRPRIEEALRTGADPGSPQEPEADLVGMRDYGFAACVETAETGEG